MADEDQIRLLTEIRDTLRASYALSERAYALSERTVGRLRWTRYFSLVVILMSAVVVVAAFLRSR